MSKSMQTMKAKKAVPRSTATGDHAKQEDEPNRSIEAQLEEQLVLEDDMGVDHEEEIQTEVPRRDPKLDARGLLTLNTIPAYREGTVKLAQHHAASIKEQMDHPAVMRFVDSLWKEGKREGAPGTSTSAAISSFRGRAPHALSASGSKRPASRSLRDESRTSSRSGSEAFVRSGNRGSKLIYIFQRKTVQLVL
ncbi:hypothetical protein Ciccas_011941, partial [Cichlidogyrus casuarinus]